MILLHANTDVMVVRKVYGFVSVVMHGSDQLRIGGYPVRIAETKT